MAAAVDAAEGEGLEPLAFRPPDLAIVAAHRGAAPSVAEASHERPLATSALLRAG
jgi:hypothetical protein